MAFASLGSGFGLYEASSPTYALGGAVVGRAYDASANFFNPATLTDLTNLTVTAGFMTEHPRGRIKTDLPGGRTSSMDPGVFWLPHFHLAIPLPWDFAFGLGVMPEYGLGSEYSDSWDLNFNSINTTVMSFTVNPNLAYKVTDEWSVGAGQQQNDFEQIIDDRYHRKSLILSSQLAVADWYGVFSNEMLAEACLDRIVHKSLRFELKGDSMRKKY